MSEQKNTASQPESLDASFELALSLINCGPQKSADPIKWMQIAERLCHYCEGTENITEAALRIVAEKLNRVQHETVHSIVEQMEKHEVAKKEFLEWWEYTPKDEPSASIDAWKSGWDAAIEFIKENA